MPLRFSRQSVLRAARLALIAGLALGASACVLPAKVRGMSNLPVDPNSPVAKDVIEASRHPGPYPSFADIPEVPTDIRPVSEWRAAVLDLKHRQARLGAEAGALPPALTDTDAYAALHRSKAGAQPTDIPPEDAEQRTRAYAQSLRERATPPPPPK